MTITDVDVAVANTGGNQLTDETAAPDDPATDDTVAAVQDTATPAVDSGPATAVGSQDETSVTQQATADLSGNATADITQIVFVFNIGVAGATSGGNTTGGAASGGEITTGSATAVGNSGDTYVTQAGAADATTAASASTVQISVTVNLGVAVANSGVNDIAGTSTGTAQVGTGSATATGNDSTTAVTQTATAIGSDHAQLVIGQQAVVVNIGVSLANTGFNGSADLAAALAGAGDGPAASQLFAALLPALLGSYAATGADMVSSGDAAAIGNQTSTFVSQTATAVASGDGSAAVQQDVSVSNLGVAVANTGLNDSGMALTPTTLDDASQAIVGQLAAYLAALFDAVHAWSPGDPAPTAPSSMTLSNGSVNLDVGSSITGTQTDIGSSDPAGGPHATIRQIVAVFTIGVSSADSGGNTATLDVGVADDGSLVLAPGGSITTGDAVAVNSGTIIVCQRADQPDAPCLQPDGEVSPPVPSVDPAAGGSGTLPVTGSDTELLLLVAALLVAAGAAMALTTRRSALR